MAPNILYTKHKRTLLQLCCYYDSVNCLSKLIEMKYDYNQIEKSNGNSPLFICCKFNCLNLVRILLSKDDCKKLVKNNDNLNEFDIAFLRGNYPICYYLLYVYKNKEKIYNDYIKSKEIENDDISNIGNINTNMNIDINKKENINNDYDTNQIYQKYFFNNNFDIDYYMFLQEENKFPLFNMSLFFKSLCQKIPPKDCKSFAPERKRTKDLITKIPDPNETWGHFFKRMVNMELYNPPLVDKKNISQMNSLYMNTQMKLIESEYGVKMNYYNPNDNYNLDEEGTPMIKINKNPKVKSNDNINKNNNIGNKKEDDEENYKIENEENLCAINIKENSSERNINNTNKNNE